MSVKDFDAVSFIMELEMGQLDQDEMISGMAELIRSGVVWSLQGAYGRSARALIDRGFITERGEVVPQ
jgi:hypothetical protein